MWLAAEDELLGINQVVSQFSVTEIILRRGLIFLMLAVFHLKWARYNSVPFVYYDWILVFTLACTYSFRLHLIYTWKCCFEIQFESVFKAETLNFDYCCVRMT